MRQRGLWSWGEMPREDEEAGGKELDRGRGAEPEPAEGAPDLVPGTSSSGEAPPPRQETVRWGRGLVGWLFRGPRVCVC